MYRYTKLLVLNTLPVLLLFTAACQPATPPPPTETPIPQASATPINTIRITSGEWPPYISETLPYQGLGSRIVTEAFALKGITVEYGYFPWARSYKLAQDGEWDGSLGWSKTPEREQDFYYSDPVFTGQDVFFHLKSTTFEWKEMKDLAGLDVGFTIDYDYGDAFRQAQEAGVFKVDEAASDEQNLKKLLAGRIDIFPLDLDVGLAMLRKNFTPEEMAQITYHPTPFRTSSFALILSKKVPRNVELLALFNAGLKELKDSGRLDQIIKESREGK